MFPCSFIPYQRSARPRSGTVQSAGLRRRLSFPMIFPSDEFKYVIERQPSEIPCMPGEELAEHIRCNQFLQYAQCGNCTRIFACLACAPAAFMYFSQAYMQRRFFQHSRICRYAESVFFVIFRGCNDMGSVQCAPINSECPIAYYRSLRPVFSAVGVMIANCSRNSWLHVRFLFSAV